MQIRIARAALAFLASSLVARLASAGGPVVDADDQGTAATAVADERTGSGSPPSASPPYSLPWQLRAVVPATALRSDSSVAAYDDGAGHTGRTVVSTVLGCYRLTPNLVPLVRVGFVHNDAPGTLDSGSSLLNPIVGLAYGRRIESWRWAVFAGGSLPIGSGSGDAPSAGVSLANAAGRDARSGMDNAMFAVNYFAAGLGADLAYVHRLTVQLEANLLQLMRVHGTDAGAQSTDAARTNATFGLHAGYFIVRHLSLGGELRYQRWVTTPTRLVNGAKASIPEANMDALTAAIGPRAHFALGHGLFLRPGISYTRALDDPLFAASYNIVQIDLPVVF